MERKVRVKENLFFFIITQSLQVMIISISLHTMRYVVMHIVICKHLIATYIIPVASSLLGAQMRQSSSCPLSVFFLSISNFR